MNAVEWGRFVRGLTEAGVNVHAAAPLADLPADFRAEIGALVGDLDRFAAVAMFGNGGPALWPHVRDRVRAGIPHPVDSYVESVIDVLAGAALAGSRVLYPSADPVFPVQRLGRVLGLCQPSRLGLDIHPEFGLWFAVRRVLLLDFTVPAAFGSARASVCDSCSNPSCQPACPARAVAADRFDLRACLQHRARENSECAEHCFARWACSHRPDQRYPLEQLRYHMGRPEHLAKIRELAATGPIR